MPTPQRARRSRYQNGSPAYIAILNKLVNIIPSCGSGAIMWPTASQSWEQVCKALLNHESGDRRILMAVVGLSPHPGLGLSACPHPTAPAVGHTLSPTEAGSGDDCGLKSEPMGLIPASGPQRASL